MPGKLDRKHTRSAREIAFNELVNAEIAYYDELVSRPIKWPRVETLRERADRIRRELQAGAHVQAYPETVDQ